MRKKILSAILSVCMVLTLMPTVAFADGTPASTLPSPNEEGIITLTEDVQLLASHEVTTNTAIDLAGHTISGDNLASLFIVKNGKKLTLKSTNGSKGRIS